ncbi:hypothetical protein OO013_05200 [Mangrovivirga sp. M17]|uniref:Uncharacterized protein n=1 Tax=Mangrovivirga halotolerans TaxID=2993936 RepID=A0ABT3RNR5_9BACT|nr:hypothetical protein [Mangrovivirga halotolerans]MCX2743250.1 hypothetical protein [Mangrovivirga halotolerans]
MNHLTKIFFCFLLIGFIACSGSDEYAGKWKATNSEGDKFVFKFEPETLTISDSTKKATSIGYTQNKISNKNGVVTYGIQLEDGRHYDILFSNPSDSTSAIILESNSQKALYVLNRNEYVGFDEAHSIE